MLRCAAQRLTDVRVSGFDDLIDNAEQRRRLLCDELRRLDEWIARARELRAAGDEAAGLVDVVDGGAPAEGRRGARPAELVAAAEAALRAADRPLSRGEIFEALRAAGVRIVGEDPVKNLGTVLWRSGRFDNAGRVYWIKGEPRPRPA